MCGIFGVFRRQSAVDERVNRLLADSMIHRGPDDEGVLAGRNWSIGMRRLSIIDLAGGHQPISNEDDTLHLVFNGEIYNHQELRAGLIARGHRFKTHSDVEVLLHLYEENGRDSILKLNGMFAFALFDSRDQSLWVARDRLGVKPLFYSWQEGDFSFSSDLSGLAHVLDAPFSKQALIDYLGYSYVPAPQTPYLGIAKLQPGEEIRVSGSGLEKRIYWRAESSVRWTGSTLDAAEELDALLKDSVKLQLISEVPLGISLSGGVDSSAIANYAAELSDGQHLRTFTIDFEGKDGSDTRFASLLSAKLRTDHTVVRVGSKDQFKALEELIGRMDEPMSDSAIVPTYLISKAARERGIRVLLSGAGGDEIFGGYPRHFPAPYFSAAWFAALPIPLRFLTSQALGLGNPALRMRLRNPARNFVVNISGVNFEFLSQGLSSEKEMRRLFERIEHDFACAGSRYAYPLMMLDVNDYLPNNILALTDKATMAASVEGRVPLIDHRIVEFAFSIPESLNLLDGKQKGLFKYVLRDRLPGVLLSREKEGFNAPIHDWVFRWPDRLREGLLGNFSPTLAEIIDRRVVERWLSDPSLRKRGASSLYSLYVLNLWLITRRK